MHVKKKAFVFLIVLIGIFSLSCPDIKAQNLLYSFQISSDSVDIGPLTKTNIITDVNINQDYTYITHQILLSDAPPQIVFETNLPKSLVSRIDISYRDSNLSWNTFSPVFDDNSTNVRLIVDTEGKRGLSDYQFNVIYTINTQNIYDLKPSILNSFDFEISNQLGPDDYATLTLTLPDGYKPYNSVGWRLQGNRFFYSTVVSDVSKNYYTIFYLEKDYEDSIVSLKNEITKLTEENVNLTERIIEMQETIEDYQTRNDELNSDVKDLKNELVQSNELRKESESASSRFRYLSWGLTLSLPGMQFLLAELREKKKITPTQLHLGSVIGTIVVFAVLYLTLFI